MAGESDQTRWVGTRKVDPAVGDLQAPLALLRPYFSVAPGVWPYVQGIFAAAAGEISVVENVVSTCDTGNPTLVEFYIQRGVVEHIFLREAHAAATDIHFWNGKLTLESTDFVMVRWTGGLVGDTIDTYALGYRIDLY